MRWIEIDSGVLPADAIMDKDRVLLQNLKPGDQPSIHFYEWKGGCATYGYFSDPYKVLDRNGVLKKNLTLAQRPTGGGIIFHLTDFAFSILIPASHPRYSLNTLDNYLFINTLVAEAIHPLVGEVDILPKETISLNQDCACFCMAKPTQYDIMLKGRKIGGAAQRRTKQGFLHQGSISLAPPPNDFLEEVLLSGNKVAEAMLQNSFFLLGTDASLDQLTDARQKIKALLKDRTGNFLL